MHNLNNYLFISSSCTEKVFVTKKWLLERNSRSRQLDVLKKKNCEKVPVLKNWLLSCQYNRCHWENGITLMESLIHSNWWSKVH